MRTLAQNDVIQHATAILGKSFKKQLESEVMHGECSRRMDRQLASEGDTLLCL